jgi:hypothetical protein
MERLEDDGVEVTDLELSGEAGSGMSSWLASTVLDWQRALQGGRARRRWRVGSTIGLLLLLVILFTLNRGTFIVNRFSPPPIQGAGTSSSLTAMPSLPQIDGIACLADVTRSLDNRFIAVLGYQDCPNPKNSYVAGLLNLYDACSGRLITQLHPDSAIIHRFNESLPLEVRHALQKDRSDRPVIVYEQVLWSLDKQHLALTFALATQQPPLRGFLLINSDDGSEEVLLHPLPASGAFSSNEVSMSKQENCTPDKVGGLADVW